MKKLVLLLLNAFLVVTLFGQAPGQINYQGVARNAVGNVLPMQHITLRLTIHDGSATGPVLYQETRKLKTNSFGLFTVAIGSSGATSITGTLIGIDWSTGGGKFLQVEMDPKGQNGFLDMGCSELLSVPFALHAQAARPTGAAGGDLSGTYPNPDIANGAVTTSKIADGSITLAKLAPGVITGTGIAGGDLTGNYPNPAIAAGVINTSKIADGAVSTNKIADGVITNAKLADNAVTTNKITDGSVTAAKLAAGLIPTSLPPSGSAGGDLNGTYPNPVINTGAVGRSKIADGAINTIKLSDGSVTTVKLADDAVTTVKIVDGSVTAAKLASGLIPTSLPPSGSAGGDLNGSYPNPVIAASAVDGSKLADGAVSTNKIVDGSVTAAKLAAGLIPTSLPPSGSAGGDLNGTYPNPVINTGAVGTSKIADGAVSTIKLADGSVTTVKLADDAVTTAKIIDGSVTGAKLAAGLIPTTLPPSGSAGGDLSGTYPNPTINSIQGVTVNATSPSNGQVLKYNGSQWIAANESGGGGGAPSGPAGGDLVGTYPNPMIAPNSVDHNNIVNGAVKTNKLEDNAVTTVKIADGSVTAAKLASGLIPTSLPPSGSAGGDLSGSYPNPVIAASAVDGGKLADGAVSTNKIVDGSVTAAKLAAGLIPTSLPPSGSAGGDLSGSYPNPVIAASAVDGGKLADGSVSTNKIVDGAITTVKIVDGSVTAAKLASGVIPTTLPPSGSAGGDLSGSYPNPAVNKIQGVTISTSAPAVGEVLKYNGTQWAPATDNTGGGGGAPSGPAGGDLSGTYPNPSINNGAVGTTKIADDAVTTNKIADGSLTLPKFASGVIPTNLPPIGTAGGDLSGNYPNPAVNKIQGVTISTTAPTNGQVLKYNGTQWAPAAELAFSLPYTATQSSLTGLFNITNSGAGMAIKGINSSTNTGAFGIEGVISSTTAGVNSAGVKGTNNGTGSDGSGVWGHHAGNGNGVYGSSVNGLGVSGYSDNMVGVLGSSDNGQAGIFNISNTSNFSDALTGQTAGDGFALVGLTTGNGAAAIQGVATNSSTVGIMAYHMSDGIAILAMNNSATSPAISAINSGAQAGVYGSTTNLDGSARGAGIMGRIDGNTGSGTTFGDAIVGEAVGSASGDLAVFRVNGTNVARVDQTGRGYFNGGTQIGGADLAEYFDVTGNRNAYEPGDVLVISTNSDRTVEKSAAPYSTLVAGVFATKPGVLLTEKNAEQLTLENGVPMGVIGVIPTKVCMEGGAIKRGDLIVTSSTPGVAMKADPDKVKVGQVIGKALQDYNGTGIQKINVLVSIK